MAIKRGDVISAVVYRNPFAVRITAVIAHSHYFSGQCRFNRRANRPADIYAIVEIISRVPIGLAVSLSDDIINRPLEYAFADRQFTAVYRGAQFFFQRADFLFYVFSLLLNTADQLLIFFLLVFRLAQKIIFLALFVLRYLFLIFQVAV